MRKYRMKRHAVVQPLDKPYRLIPLTQGQNAIVDAEDFERLDRWNWSAFFMKDRGSFVAGRCTKKTTLFMHVEILGTGPGELVDHWNHDTLDNRKENLRKCTPNQNQYNCLKRRDNKSGYKGVTWDKKAGKWSGHITFDGKQKFLGYFPKAEDAAKAYDAASEIFHGEFGYRNFPHDHSINQVPNSPTQ